jgi:intein/homing endonuclease
MSLSNEYVAGLFDGEGCIQATCSKKAGSRRLQTTIRNSHQGVLRLIQARWGGSICRTAPKGNRSASYGWSITSRGALAFLKDIEPFLIIKRAEALLAFEFQDTMQIWGGRKGKLSEEMLKQRDKISNQMKILKRTYREYKN